MTKHLSPFITTIALLSALPAQALDINVAVTGLKSDAGSLVLKVYDSEQTWLSDDTVALEERDLAPGDSGQTVSIPVQLKPGRYGLSVYHDKNSNGKLDSNFIGIPKEPVGLSNDHRPKFGPPRFEKAAIDIERDQVVDISLD